MKYQPFESGHFFHIYNRGNNNENLFLEQDNYNYFLVLMKKYLLQVADVYSYCLLPNHFHVLVKFYEVPLDTVDLEKKKSNLHQPISNMLNAYTKAINKRHNRRGSLFQEHLKRIKITEESYLRNLIVYINTNSTHHDIEDYRTYKHSSYDALIGEQKTALKRDEVIELFDDLNNFKHVLHSKRLDIDAIQELILE
ncbi:transposase [Gelidibacter maritimus]|uniref:Transposase n=1 Tax=Gelidibacter maritimus TaxID=2761487 RepID=A0A7W2M817_9FLAO|nr:transposase [Gelidibacter maritimus]MBA6154384.1 transposase [Gelidibacter maritimus]